MAISGFVKEWWGHKVIYGPSNRLFSDLRLRHYHGLLQEGSGKFSSRTGLSIPCPGKVWIGDDVGFNEFVILNACDGGEIRIGDHSLIGPFVLMRAADHIFTDQKTRINLQGHHAGHIHIGEDCWVGGHVMITRDVTIGEGSVIGGGSVVTHDIPPFSVAVGNPAHVIKSREG
jgi:acetyltransferase-like isoleucine patch superfamily enzyme